MSALKDALDAPYGKHTNTSAGELFLEGRTRVWEARKALIRVDAEAARRHVLEGRAVLKKLVGLQGR